MSNDSPDAPDAPVNPRLARLVEDARFSPVRGRTGYDMGEVDSFLDQVVTAAEGRGTLTSAEVREAAFTRVKLREGYAVAEVDAFLEQLERALADGWVAPHEQPAPAKLEGSIVDGEAARLIGEVRFTPTRRGGYDMGEVDAFLDRIVDAFRGRTVVTPAEVRDVRFTEVRWREAYVRDEVRATLAHVERRLSGGTLRPPPAPR